MNRQKIFILFTCTFFFLTASVSTPLVAETAVIDFIVASVNGKPITLSEVAARANTPTPKTPTDASNDPAIQSALQQVILEYLLRAEARERRLSASPEEVERYVDRVAQQNQLSREEFAKALAAEGKNIERYKSQVEMDILRTKLASNLIRDGISISDKEVDEYLTQNGEESAKIEWREKSIPPFPRLL